MRKYLAGGLNKEEQGKEPVPTTNDTEEKDDTFPTPIGALMIFGGSTAYDSRRRQKVARRRSIPLDRLCQPISGGRNPP